MDPTDHSAFANPDAFRAACDRYDALIGRLSFFQRDAILIPDPLNPVRQCIAPGKSLEPYRLQAIDLVHVIASAAIEWSLPYEVLREVVADLSNPRVSNGYSDGNEPDAIKAFFHFHQAMGRHDARECVNHIKAEASIRGRHQWLFGQRPAAPSTQDKVSVESEPVRPQVITEASPDFSSVIWYGKTHLFTGTQSQVVKLLWEQWERGPGLGLYEATIAESLEKEEEKFRLRDLFKGHEAWGAMIMAADAPKGFFALKKI